MPIQFGSITHFFGPPVRVAQTVQSYQPGHYLSRKVIQGKEGLVLTGRDVAELTEKKLGLKPEGLVEAGEFSLMDAYDGSKQMKAVRQKSRYEQLFFERAMARKLHAFEQKLQVAFKEKGISPAGQVQMHFDYYDSAKRNNHGKDVEGHPIQEVVIPFDDKSAPYFAS